MAHEADDDNKRIRRGLADIALRCFRDSGDRDYIAARLAYRAGLYPQFLWSGLQALEKHMKCILLSNRIEATKIRHNLGAALALIERRLFALDLGPDTRKFIAHLDDIGKARYLEQSWWIEGNELLRLDEAVWSLRRYCQVGAASEALKATALSARTEPAVRFRINGGLLEAILEKRTHPARAGLIWKNFRYGMRHRQRIKWRRHFSAENAPLCLSPSAIDEACKYIHVPRELAAGYRELAEEQKERARAAKG